MGAVNFTLTMMSTGTSCTGEAVRIHTQNGKLPDYVLCMVQHLYSFYRQSVWNIDCYNSETKKAVVTEMLTMKERRRLL